MSRQRQKPRPGLSHIVSELAWHIAGRGRRQSASHIGRSPLTESRQRVASSPWIRLATNASARRLRRDAARRSRFSRPVAARADTDQHYAPPDPGRSSDYQPKFFDTDDFAALQAFTAILIPTDDTPGAREAHCAHFIDFLLQASTEACAGPRRAVARRRCRRCARPDSMPPTPPARAALVAAMSRPERDRGATHPAYAAYRLIKQQNTFAFYTSRAGTDRVRSTIAATRSTPTFPACDHPEHRTV